MIGSLIYLVPILGHYFDLCNRGIKVREIKVKYKFIVHQATPSRSVPVGDLLPTGGDIGHQVVPLCFQR